MLEGTFSPKTGVEDEAHPLAATTASAGRSLSDNPEEAFAAFSVGNQPASVWVVLPTLNEAQNVGIVIDRLRAAAPQATILVVDDDSPDGTAEVVGEISAGCPEVRLLRRRGARGFGDALLFGMRSALVQPSSRRIKSRIGLLARRALGTRSKLAGD